MPDDPAFRALVRARDPQALSRIFEFYWTPLYERARLILPPRFDPEDAAGEVILRMVEEADAIDPSRPRRRRKAERPVTRSSPPQTVTSTNTTT